MIGKTKICMRISMNIFLEYIDQLETCLLFFYVAFKMARRRCELYDEPTKLLINLQINYFLLK